MMPLRLRAALVALLVWALLPSLARADDTADEAEFRFRRAADLYMKGKFDEALGEFFASNRLVRNRNVTFNIARCFEALGQLNEAYRYYNDLLSEPWGADDRAALEQALVRLRPKVALVRVETEPAGADVFVDRRDLGSRGLAPRVVALPPGKALVIADLKGFRSAQQEVLLEKGKEVVVHLPLARIWGHFAITSDPAGADVRLDAADAPASCQTPCELQVLPGKHVLHVSADGRLPWRKDVEVGLDQTLALKAVLAPRPPPVGKLVVTANRDGALVKVDGVEAGFTPVVVDTITVGAHQVEVSYDDLETWKSAAEIEEGRSATVRARLSVPAPRVSAAAKTLESAEDSAASVTVITSEEIRAFGYQTLAQALRSVRGFYVSNDRSYEYVGVRGFQPPGDFNTRLLILVDGHPINNAWNGQAGVGADLDVDLSQVERIEVVRGPGSALYGSDAVFGVVNVVHRTAPRAGLVEALGSAGNLGQMRGRVTAGVDGEKYGASVSVAALRADGADTTVVHLDPYGQSGLVKGLDGERASHVHVFGHAGDFRFVGSLNDRTKQAPNAPYDTIFGAPGTELHDQRAFAELRYEHAFQNGSTVAARGYYDMTWFHGQYQYEEGAQRESDGARSTGAEARWRSGSLLGKHQLTVGAEVQRWLQVKQRVYFTDQILHDDDHTGSVLSLYALDSWHVSPRLTAEVGVRGDHYPEGIGLTANPRVALVARPYEGGITKLLAGRAFRAPNVYERFYSDGDLTIKQAGALDPEIILTGELEHTHRVNEEVTATAAAFVSDLSNVIRLERDPADGLLSYVNGKRPIRAYGAEMEVRWQPSRLALVAFNYSFQYSRELAPAGSSDASQPLVNSPAHLASLRAMVPLVRSLTGGFEVTYGSARQARDGSKVGEVLLVNATFSGDLPQLGLFYRVGAYNLLDAQYSFPAGSEFRFAANPQYGRTVQMTLGKSF